MSSKIQFYDQYHTKNDHFSAVIQPGNFTYYYVLRFLHEYCLPKLPQKRATVRVLDIGCGVGTLSLYVAAKLGLHVDGIDVSPRAISICQNAQKSLKLKNVTFKRGELKKGNAKYNLVMCLEVIEHIADDKKFLKNIHSNLKKGGILLLTTPSKENFLYKIGFYKNFDREVGHVRRYTNDHLRELLEENGFEVLQLHETEGIFRNILFTTKLDKCVRFFKGPLVPLFHFIDELTIPFFGASDIAIVAEKREK